MAQAVGQRPFQVVVWGATGFTGRLVCEHLVKDYKGKVRWAMAGRDEKKLQQIRDELVQFDPDSKSIPYVLADANDAATLKELAAKTDVIISTAGPFAKYGTQVVEASVEQGTHYCDITGELLWVKRMIQQHHEKAAQNGVKVLHCCGYDSVPFDIGTLVVVDHMQNKLGKNVSQVYGLVQDARGGVSGGTIASGFNQFETEDGSEIQRCMNDKYYLVPPKARQGSDRPPQVSPEWNGYTKEWMAPFVMEPINSRIVQRSNALAAKPYGSDFKYREGMGMGSWSAAAAVAGGTTVANAMMAVGPLRQLAKKIVPAPGQGPSRDLMLGGYWKHKMVGVSEEAPGQAPAVVVVDAHDNHRDGGYWGTARMLLETGLCLALDGQRCEAAGHPKGGVLTPASALGLVLVERLKAADIHFDVVQSPALAAK